VTERRESMKDNYIVQAWLVILLSLCFGGVLAGVQIGLSQRIADNKLAETMGQIPQLVPGAEEAASREDEVAGQRVYRAYAGGEQIGWVIPCGGQGFADRIELLVGVDVAAEKITGLYVLEQKETPGLGNKIVEDGWRSQFAGKTTMRGLAVTKAGAKTDSEIDAVTGATISSESVCQIVNQSLEKMRGGLIAAAGKE